MIANGIAAGYSLVQGMRCVVSMVRGNVLFSKPLAWLIFSGDQVILLPKTKKKASFFYFCLTGSLRVHYY